MIIFEYLFWILFIGYGNFVAIRLMWLYEQVEGHLFWKKISATSYYIGAALLGVVLGLILLKNFHVIFLLILLIGEYVLFAAAVVKVSDRGIMANGFMARWPEILYAKRMGAGQKVFIITNKSWQRMPLQVPTEKEAAFRKMLAAKGVRIIDEETTKAGANAESFA
jgi:hypothetical protein